MPKQTQQSARSVIVNAIWHTDDAIPLGRALTLADDVLIALTEAGLVIVPQVKWSSPLFPPVVNWDDTAVAPGAEDAP